MEQMTEQQVAKYIRDARDSVTVINEELEKLVDFGWKPSLRIKDSLKRNIGHLKIVVQNENVIECDDDCADLHKAIADGEAALAKYTWPIPPDPEDEF